MEILESSNTFLEFQDLPEPEEIDYYSRRELPKKKRTLDDSLFINNRSYPDESASKEEFESFRRWNNRRWNKYNKTLGRYSNKIREKLPQDKQVIRVQYCDECGGLHAAMEHGDLFKNVPHIRISYH